MALDTMPEPGTLVRHDTGVRLPWAEGRVLRESAAFVGGERGVRVEVTRAGPDGRPKVGAGADWMLRRVHLPPSNPRNPDTASDADRLRDPERTPSRAPGTRTGRIRCSDPNLSQAPRVVYVAEVETDYPIRVVADSPEECRRLAEAAYQREYIDKGQASYPTAAEGVEAFGFYPQRHEVGTAVEGGTERVLA